jgi:uncharacterized protein (DUF1778 family)
MAGKRAAANSPTVVTPALPRKERLEARVSLDQKELFQRAAEAQGRTLTDFVIASVHEAAVRTLDDLQAIKLTAQESHAFAEALLNPREPGRRLRAAADRYLASAEADRT